MFFDANKTITSLDGQPLKEGEREVTIGSVACNALLAPFDDERGLSGEEKVKRFELAVKISKANGLPAEITVEDAALIKKLVAKLYAPLVVGQVWQAVDNPSASA